MLSETLGALGALVVDTSIRAAASALAVAIVLAILRVRAPNVRHAAWTAVLAAMLTMPLLLSVVPAVEVPVPSSFVVLDTEKSEVIVDARPLPVAPSAPASNPAITAAAPKLPVQQEEFRRPWLPIALVFVYVAGFALLLARTLYGWYAVTRMASRARRAENVPGRLAFNPDARVLASPEVVIPVTAGVLRPAIILPSSWTSWDEGVVRGVVAHEVAHVKRRDTLVAFVAGLNRAVFWFHPLSWWLVRKLAITAEYACDEEAARLVGEPRQYARILVEMADLVRLNQGRIAWQGAGVDGVGALGSRIDRILRRDALVRTSPVQKVMVPVVCAAAIGGVIACKQQISAAPLREDPEVAKKVAVNKARSERARRAMALTVQEAAAMEEALLKNPTDTETRQTLLEFYMSRGKVRGDDTDAARRRQRHALWFIQHPQADVYIPVIDPRHDPVGAMEAKKAWTLRLQQKDVGPLELARAASFFGWSDKPYAELLLLDGKAREPQNTAWSVRLGQLYALAIAGVRDPTGSKTDPAEAASPFATHAREVLQSSKDAAMLQSAGLYLITRGRRSDGSSFEQSALGRGYLERALQLDPGSVQARRGVVYADTNERRVRIDRDIRALRGGASDAFDQFSDDQYRAVSALPEPDRLFYLPSAAELAYMRAENVDWTARSKPDKERTEAQQKAETGWRRARQYAEDALTLAERHRSAPEYGAVVYRSTVVLAVLALKSGDRQAAVRYMRAAGDVPESDELKYGPFVSLRSRLVEYLLREGERESVAAFLDKSAELSITERDQLEADAAKIRSGIMPMGYQFAEARLE